MGLLRYSNGDEFLGLFEKNKRCGRGTFVVSQGIMYRSVFSYVVVCGCVCVMGRVGIVELGKMMLRMIW